jgi:hypothetical protein
MALFLLWQKGEFCHRRNPSAKEGTNMTSKIEELRKTYLDVGKRISEYKKSYSSFADKFHKEMVGYFQCAPETMVKEDGQFKDEWYEFRLRVMLYDDPVLKNGLELSIGFAILRWFKEGSFKIRFANHKETKFINIDQPDAFASYNDFVFDQLKRFLERSLDHLMEQREGIRKIGFVYQEDYSREEED